jgi:CheY-like chemotaxis protein
MILFVDDDMIYIKDYLEELSDHYAVHHEHSIDKAFEFIIENSREIKLLVLDMMIPSGNLLEGKDNDNGRRTGRLFIEELKKKIDLTLFPIIIFTHVNIENIQPEISGITVRKLQKEDFTPYMFLSKIIEIMSFTTSEGTC